MNSVDLDFCENCVYGKQKRVNFSMVKKTPKAEKLELVHTDIWVRLQFPPSGAYCIFVTFINDSSRKVWVYFLKHKSDVCEVSKK